MSIRLASVQRNTPAELRTEHVLPAGTPRLSSTLGLVGLDGILSGCHIDVSAEFISNS
jgi:hypothetical protein